MTVTYDYTATTGNERWHDLNIFPGTLQPQTGRTIYDRSRRPYPFAGQVIQREATAVAHYQALTVSANKRFSHRFQMQGFYTYGRNFTNDDNENNCCSAEGYDQFNWKLDWSRSRLDIRHNFVFNSVVDLPFGVQVSPIVKAQSGRPFDATTGTDSPTAFVLSSAALVNFQGYIGRPSAVVYGGGNGDSNFTDRPIVDGTLLPRNFFTQPSYFRTDLRVSKVVRFGERRELRGIVDLFNLFNNENKFTTNTVMSNTSFGTLNNADDPFAIQVAAKFIW